MIAVEKEIELLYPLTLFRRHEGAALPAYTVIEEAAMPEPYHRLLVHHGDMTSRLEKFHGGAIILQLLHREKSPQSYRREVVLRMERSGLAVEYGAIEIELASFEPELRERILEEHHPLGGLLNRFGVRYSSRPRAFFRLGPDLEMNTLFGAASATGELYGRSNELLDEEGRTLARIVEVLRP